MGRGRKRKFNPNIPSHIDQDALPAGVRWKDSGGGSWHAFVNHESGRQTSVCIAGRKALLSELHAIMEQRAGKVARGSVQSVADQFSDSTEWAELKPATQRDYRIHAKVACDLPTKVGGTFGNLQVDALTVPVIQQLVERLAKGTPESRPGAGDAVPCRPSTANHVLRYLRRLFAWGIQHGACKTNPADGVRATKERKRNTMPERDAFGAVLAYARQRGAMPMRSPGSCPPYLAPIMLLAFMCRMRGGEVIRLTDANATPGGILVNRLKGSRDNVVAWTPELRAVWADALDVRGRILSSPKRRSRPTQLRPESRPLFVGSDGGQLSKGALDQAVQKLMASAISDQVIAESERFSLHGLKHRGITDTAGNRADKQQASGHKSSAMMDIYDHEIPVVAPARPLGTEGDSPDAKAKKRG